MADKQILEIKQGEGKWIKFTITRAGVGLDVSSGTFKFGVKQKLRDTAYVHSVDDVDFDKSLSVSGIVRANVPASKTAVMNVGDYDAELKVELVADTDVDKSQRFTIRIKPAVITD